LRSGFLKNNRIERERRGRSASRSPSGQMLEAMGISTRIPLGDKVGDGIFLSVF